MFFLVSLFYSVTLASLACDRDSLKLSDDNNALKCRLSIAPSSAVTFTIASRGLVFSNCSVSFTVANWNQYQNIMLRALPRFTGPESTRYSVIFRGSGGGEDYDKKNFPVCGSITRQQGGVCTIIADPHYTSLSGLTFDDQLTGTYYLFKSNKLHVQALQKTWANGPTSVVQAISVSYGGTVGVIDTRKNPDPLSLSWDVVAHNSTSVKFEKESPSHTAVFPDGSKLSVTMYSLPEGQYLDSILTLAPGHSQISGYCAMTTLSELSTWGPSQIVPDAENHFLGKYVPMDALDVTFKECLVPNGLIVNDQCHVIPPHVATTSPILSMSTLVSTSTTSAWPTNTSTLAVASSVIPSATRDSAIITTLAASITTSPHDSTSMSGKASSSTVRETTSMFTSGAVSSHMYHVPTSSVQVALTTTIPLRYTPLSTWTSLAASETLARSNSPSSTPIAPLSSSVHFVPPPISTFMSVVPATTPNPMTTPSFTTPPDKVKMKELCEAALTIPGCEHNQMRSFFINACVSDVFATRNYKIIENMKQGLMMYCKVLKEYEMKDPSDKVAKNATELYKKIGFGPDTTCVNSCSNHGQCQSTGCVCNTGFTGFDCSIKTGDLPKPILSDASASFVRYRLLYILTFLLLIV